MKEVIQKNTLSFSCSKKMKYLRTPKDIWKNLSEEFNFTCDMCASDENHLIDKYYTIDNSALDKDWNDEVGYVHPYLMVKLESLLRKHIIVKDYLYFYYPHQLTQDIFINIFINVIM